MNMPNKKPSGLAHQLGICREILTAAILTPKRLVCDALDVVTSVRNDRCSIKDAVSQAIPEGYERILDAPNKASQRFAEIRATNEDIK